MRYMVAYDTEIDGEQHELEAAEVPLLGQEPVSIENRNWATYEFPDDTREEDILAALDKSNWCFLSASEVAESPEP